MKAKNTGKFNFIRFVFSTLILFSMLAVIPASPAHAVVGRCYVNNKASGGDGTSWAAAYLDIQTAIGDTGCTEIWVAAGVYLPGGTRDSFFMLKNGVAIYGGFNGTETMLEQGNPLTNPTILSGNVDGNPRDNYGNAYHVVRGDHTDATAILDGFTISTGYADGDAAAKKDRGAGIYISQGSPTLRNLTIRNNFASASGAGIHIFDGNALLENITIYSNSATNGAGLNISQGQNTLRNVTFSSNMATQNGGGIFNNNGALNLINVTFTNNTAEVGGAIFNVNANPFIQNTILWGNTATSSDPELSIASGSPIIKFSVIQGGCPAGVTCMNVINADPKLGTLGNYGGRTETIPLLGYSSAINTGNNATCPATDQRGISRPQGSQCDIGAIEKEHFTMVLKSIGKHDGWVLESGKFTGKGGKKNNLGKVLLLGDDALDKQYRAILSFNTAGIPDGAVITKVILKVKKAGVVGTNPMNTHNSLVVDIKPNRFSTRVTLQLNDFQAMPKRAKVGKFAKRLYSGWYKAVLYASGRNNINKTGLTQFRLRFLRDDNDDYGADILKLYSGNAGTSSRPQLIVQYYEQ